MKIGKYIELGKVDLNDPFFDSLKASYPKFNDWFTKKTNSKAHVVYENDKIIGLLFLQNKGNGTMKISTFKVIQSNRRLGERFIGIALKTAAKENIRKIYTTLFENENTKPLVKLLTDWGFVYDGIKEKTGELRYCKTVGYYDGKAPMINYPYNLANKNAKFYWLPIENKYHNKLIGFDAGTPKLDKVYDDRASVFTVQKYYITNVPQFKLRTAKSGDILLLYRMGPDNTKKAYSSIVTCYAVFEKYESLQNLSLDEFLARVKNRTAYSDEELREIHKNNSGKFFALISFLFIEPIMKTETQYWILKDLWDMSILERPKGPRQFDRISNENFKKLIKIKFLNIKN